MGLLHARRGAARPKPTSSLLVLNYRVEDVKSNGVSSRPSIGSTRACFEPGGSSPPCSPAFGTRFGTHHHTHALRPFVGCGRGSCLWTQADARKLSQVFRRQLPFLALGREFNECPI